MAYEIKYTENVIDFILTWITSERVYKKIDDYRAILTDFPKIGTPYSPYYPAAQLPFPCRWIAIPDTPFTLYYIVDDEAESIVIFHIEHQSADPQKRFDWSTIDL